MFELQNQHYMYSNRYALLLGNTQSNTVQLYSSTILHEIPAAQMDDFVFTVVQRS
jgi:hypothetical protein